MDKVKFYKCNTCGNIIEMVDPSGVPVVCCGTPMQELIPNTVDASMEKHVPAVTVEGNTVSVKIGSVEHPMASEHYIKFIVLETTKGVYRCNLKPGDAPNAVFTINNEKPLSVYEYCSIHGLWKADI
ncbi:MAG: desulfoferrodoxin [Treponema sp.]|jgi:superoxide reductase|nr:desulfoferrodoxin [Treponema sp.]